MKKLISLLITIVVFAVIFFKIDNSALMTAFSKINIFWFCIALMLFVPQLLLISYRWKIIAKVYQDISLTDSLKMVLASQTLNLFFPSKAGDLAKAAFLQRNGATNTVPLSYAINLVIFEKIQDIIALTFVFLTGCAISLMQAVDQFKNLFIPALLTMLVIVLSTILLYWATPKINKTIDNPKFSNSKLGRILFPTLKTISLISQSPKMFWLTVVLAISIWIAHMTQIWCLFYCLKDALDGTPSIQQFLIGVPGAIYVGLLPITVAGFGTRDTAFIAFFSNFPTESMLAVSMLINLRYILPALLGAPFISGYFRKRSDI